MIVKIENLRLRAVVGTEQSERREKQDVVVNVEFEYDGEPAAERDDIACAVDYGEMVRRIADDVESSRCFLLEALCRRVAGIVMSDPKVAYVTVRVAKPNALPQADSVSVSCALRR